MMQIVVLSLKADFWLTFSLEKETWPDISFQPVRKDEDEEYTLLYIYANIPDIADRGWHTDGAVTGKMRKRRCVKTALRKDTS